MQFCLSVPQTSDDSGPRQRERSGSWPENQSRSAAGPEEPETPLATKFEKLQREKDQLNETLSLISQEKEKAVDELNKTHQWLEVDAAQSKVRSRSW